MYNRPLSIAVTGWILSIGGALAIFSGLRMLFAGDESYLPGSPPGASYAVFGLVLAVINFVCGVNILQGANWARWLYTGLCGFLLILELSAFPNGFFSMLVYTFMRGTIVLVLFLPDANDFFSSR